jgi:hypothetical protein
VGRLLLLLAVVLLAVPAHAQVRELVSFDYVLYYHTRDAAAAQVAARAANQSFPRLRATLGLRPGERVAIYLATDDQEFRRLTGSDPLQVLGEAFPERRFVVVQTLNEERLTTLVGHELTHVLLADLVAQTGAEPPRWVHEGVAKYAANDFGPADRMLLTEAVNSGTLIAPADLDKAFDGPPEKISLAYAESYTLVDYLAHLEPSAGLRPFLRQLAQVGDVNRALLRSYNLTPETLTAQWRQSMILEYLGRSNEDLALTALWMAMALLFAVAVVVQLRRAALIRHRLLDEEEARLGMLTMWDFPPAGEAPTEAPEEDSDERLR